VDFSPEQQNNIRLYFRLSIILKGVVSALEVIGGVLALFIPVSLVVDFITQLAEGHMTDSDDVLWTMLYHGAQNLSLPSGGFIAFYLLSRGLIKVVLIVALLRNKLWAYPSALIFLGILVVYQIFLIFKEMSLALILLTAFDLIVMWLIWLEYRIVQEQRKHAMNS
jgi:uncharacterized membrane protein